MSASKHDNEEHNKELIITHSADHILKFSCTGFGKNSNSNWSTIADLPSLSLVNRFTISTFNSRISYLVQTYTINDRIFLWLIFLALPSWNLELSSLLSSAVIFLQYFYLFSFQHPASNFSATKHVCTSNFNYKYRQI